MPADFLECNLKFILINGKIDFFEKNILKKKKTSKKCTSIIKTFVYIQIFRSSTSSRIYSLPLLLNSSIQFYSLILNRNMCLRRRLSDNIRTTRYACQEAFSKVLKHFDVYYFFHRIFLSSFIVKKKLISLDSCFVIS